MHGLCESVGSEVCVFLQPTLHDVESKPVTEDEQAKCIPPEGPDPSITIDYDMLRERGKRLAAKGIQFVDTSYLFEDIETTWCYDRAHFTRRGNKLLAKRIAQVMLAD
ncbi:MAG: hypothetical protein ACI841_003965 [Planctomycetota bacterium]|jgi:hypothetical protein